MWQGALRNECRYVVDKWKPAPSNTYMLEIKIFVDNPKPEKYLDLETITFVAFVYLLMANDVEQSETTSKDSISLLFWTSNTRLTFPIWYIKSTISQRIE